MLGKAGAKVAPVSHCRSPNRSMAQNRAWPVHSVVHPKWATPTPRATTRSATSSSKPSKNAKPPPARSAAAPLRLPTPASTHRRLPRPRLDLVRPSRRRAPRLGRHPRRPANRAEVMMTADRAIRSVPHGCSLVSGRLVPGGHVAAALRDAKSEFRRNSPKVYDEPRQSPGCTPLTSHCRSAFRVLRSAFCVRLATDPWPPATDRLAVLLGLF